MILKNTEHNKNVESKINDNTTFIDFNSTILDCARETAMKPKYDNKGWFHHSRDVLVPTLSKRNALLHELRSGKDFSTKAYEEHKIVR